MTVKRFSREGWDIFYFSSGERGQAICKVCGATCIVTRDVTVRRGSGPGHEVLVDQFECPNSDQDGHHQTREQIEEEAFKAEELEYEQALAACRS
jgi:hypothetical protein